MEQGCEHSGIGLTLNRAEAIVFFEFLSRYTDTNKLEIEDQAEQRVLWDLCAMLESELNEPISANYDEILAGARASVRDVTD